jgi:hypothetical protein
MGKQSTQYKNREIDRLIDLPSNKGLEEALSKISSISRDDLKTILDNAIAKHPYIRLSSDAGVANMKIWDSYRKSQDIKRKEHFEKRCDDIKKMGYSYLINEISEHFPYDYDELYNTALLIPSWLNGHEHTLKDILNILIAIGYPDISLFNMTEGFFKTANRIARALNYNKTPFIQLILFLLQPQEVEEDYAWIVFLSDLYPFTNENVNELVKWLVGKNSSKITYEGEDYEFYATDVSFAKFAQKMIDALAPKKYDLTQMMIKEWILSSKDQLTSQYGIEAFDLIQQNIDDVVSNIELPVFDFEIQVDDVTYPLGEYINDGNKLTEEIVNEIAHVIPFLRIGIECRDNISLASFSANILKMGVKTEKVSWENVEFCKSYIVVHFKPDTASKEFTHRLPCTYSSPSIARIISEKPQLKKLVINRLAKVHCAYNKYGIIEILNKEQVLQTISYISVICRSLEPFSTNGSGTVHSFLLSLKNQCYEFLVKHCLNEYATVLIKEKCQGYSGASKEENAAVFVVRDDNGRLNVVYENENIARSTYVFAVSKESYSTLINEIKKYFMSNEANKRQRLISDVSMFRNIKGVYSVRRINHNDMSTWRMEVMW